MSIRRFEDIMVERSFALPRLPPKYFRPMHLDAVDDLRLSKQTARELLEFLERKDFLEVAHCVPEKTKETSKGY